MKHHHLSSSHKRISALREELSQISIPTYPNELLPLLKNWIAKATPVIKQDWPRSFDEFQTCATFPGGPSFLEIATVSYLSDQQLRTAWAKDNQEAQEVQQRILGFLEGLLSLPNTPQLPGLFYLFAMLFSVALPVVVFLLTDNLAVTAFILFAALLIFTLSGAFHLRQSGSLSQKNFMQLMGMVFKQIPFLHKR